MQKDSNLTLRPCILDFRFQVPGPVCFHYTIHKFELQFRTICKQPFAILRCFAVIFSPLIEFQKVICLVRTSGGIRTHDPRLKRPQLWPTQLQRHFILICGPYGNWTHLIRYYLSPEWQSGVHTMQTQRPLLKDTPLESNQLNCIFKA